jgi:hypothetical protein
MLGSLDATGTSTEHTTWHAVEADGGQTNAYR